MTKIKELVLLRQHDKFDTYEDKSVLSGSLNPNKADYVLIDTSNTAQASPSLPAEDPILLHISFCLVPHRFPIMAVIVGGSVSP